MILVDDPASFPAALLGDPCAEAPDPGAAELWQALAPGRQALGHTGPRFPDNFWRCGYLSTAPDKSQFDILRDAATTGPTWCLAAAGSGCRGQHGRRWQALPGNVHLSVALPAGVEQARPGLTLNGLAAVATLDALAGLLPTTPVAIKWVNDLWLAGGKVGGVLTAARSRPGGGEVFLGIGLNVAATPDLEPDRFTPRASCLDAHGLRPLDLAAVVTTLLETVRRRWEQLRQEGPGPLVAAYRRASLVTGRTVILWPDNGGEAAPLVRGRVSGIADDLGLVLEGEGEPCYAGRLELGEP